MLKTEGQMTHNAAAGNEYEETLRLGQVIVASRVLASLPPGEGLTAEDRGARRKRMRDVIEHLTKQYDLGDTRVEDEFHSRL